MALFGRSKKPAAEKKAKKAADVQVTEAPKKSSAAQQVIGILTPRLTEKATIMAEKQQAYTFQVPLDANKRQVVAAIKNQFKVTPIRVNMVKLPRKMVFVRGKSGTSSAIKKAIVFLKKGDKIEFV